MDFSRDFDLLILGGGNAALCAALAARKRGLAVLVAEVAPAHFRGGNSRHTRNMRTMHSGPLDVLTGRTKGLAIFPLGSINAAFHPNPKLRLNVEE